MSVLLSMTGFGQAEYRTPRLKFTAQARAVNHRFLDVKIKWPRAEWMALDHAARKRIAEKCSRGAIEILVSVDAAAAKGSAATQTIQFSVIESLLKQVEAWQKSSAKIGSKGAAPAAPLTMDTLLRLPGVFANAVTAELEDFDENILLSRLIDPVLDSLIQARKTEGASLRKHLLDLLGQMHGHIEKISKLEAEEQAQTKKTVTERIQKTLELLESARDRVEETGFNKRLAEEAALWIDRRSFEEERVRFAAHLDNFEKILNAPALQAPAAPHQAPAAAPHGKKLEFLQQELHREVNTLGNKAQSTKIAEHALALKSLLENLKEQLANVE